MLFALFVLGYNAWMASILAVYAIAMLFTLGVATAPCLWQTITWMLIKVFERGLWTLFVYILRKDIRHYAEKISFDNTHAEAILFIAVIPLALGECILVIVCLFCGHRYVRIHMLIYNIVYVYEISIFV